ncbi:MAG TPA: peptidase M3 [Porphyromonadaceae bacterium]|nr:peptidase M3 [Porphyromonadaceae bacterium]
MTTWGLHAEKKNTEAEMNNKNLFFETYATPFNVPPFDKIRMEDYKPAFLKGMEEHKKDIDAIVNNQASPDFENTIVALDRCGNLLRNVRTVFSGLNSANTTDEMQELNREMSPLMSQHYDDINLNPQLFNRVKQVYDRQNSLNLNKEQKKLLEETYKSFVRNGANLPEEKQKRLRELNSQISLLQLTFGQNMLKETNAFQLVIDKQEDLSGLPQSLINVAADEAKATGKEGQWIFTLHNPSVMPFLQFSDKRELREKIFNGYINRGNNSNDADNKEVVKQLVTLRLEKAKLMGYEDYAAFALEERMAKNEKNVYELLDNVWAPALSKAKEEAADLQAMMKKDGIEGELKGWDWQYYNEKVKKEKYDIDENEIRPYFKLENVLDGLFYVVNKLYNISFTEIKDIPKPHEDAMAFECKNADGTHRGVLYMDFFPRSSKRGGAWCGTYRSQTYKDGERVGPVVTIVCNFTKPSAGQPALLSLDESETMFHEFGHALHNLFKDVHYYGVSNVPRDFVELPSQIMEHWVLEPEVLKVYAKHYQTGEVMPESLVKKIDNSSKYGQGFATAEYLQASFLDMDYHVLKEIPSSFDILKFEAGSMNRRGALSQIPPRYRTTYFNHTMGGGYTAGYYSYMWSEVLDADAFEAFKETGNIFDKKTAEKFRDFILVPGSIDDAMEMYKNFRGKEPGIEPLLKNRGLK